jgi:hypothetical protein
MFKTDNFLSASKTCLFGFEQTKKKKPKGSLHKLPHYLDNNMDFVSIAKVNVKGF